MGAGRSLWRTVDLMWRLAGLGGEPSEGFSYYSRRATLAGCSGRAFLYWLDDHSPDCAESWAFVDVASRSDADRPRPGRGRALVGVAHRTPWSAGSVTVTGAGSTAQ